MKKNRVDQLINTQLYFLDLSCFESNWNTFWDVLKNCFFLYSRNRQANFTNVLHFDVVESLTDSGAALCDSSTRTACWYDVLCCDMMWCAILYCIVLCCDVMCCVAWRGVVWCGAVLCCVVFHCCYVVVLCCAVSCVKVFCDMFFIQLKISFGWKSVMSDGSGDENIIKKGKI